MKNANINIIGGGTVFHVRNHLALTAPAYGTTARALYKILRDLTGSERAETHQREYGSPWPEDVPFVQLHLTKMAGESIPEDQPELETNNDISNLIDRLVAEPMTKIIFFNPALVDYEGYVADSKGISYNLAKSTATRSGKYEERLQTSRGEQHMLLLPAPKLISKIRKERKDVFLVGFKTTCGATEDEQFLTGLNLLKTSSCNLVLANDTKTRVNMIITPEQARYNVTTNRQEVLVELAKMALARADGTFTRSTVVEGKPISWNNPALPNSLREVVNHCIKAGAYKPFNGATVGHFAYKPNDSSFVTSKRKSNFNELDKVGMVLCAATETEGKVIAYGAKPSVGGQSQRIIFKDHPDTNCIVHFHCPPKPESKAALSVRLQRNFECGSHECGKNTSEGLMEAAPGIKCVYLDNHGPNIVFDKSIDPHLVIKFIDDNFDLSKSTDGVDRSKVLVA